MATLLAHYFEHTSTRVVPLSNRPQKAELLVIAQNKAKKRPQRAADPSVRKKIAILTGVSSTDRGLLALLLYHNNYQIVFLEPSQDIVDMINNAGSYTVSEFDEQGVQVNSVVISNCRAIHATSQSAQVVDAISEADIVTIRRSQPPQYFASIIRNLALGINARNPLHRPRPLIVISVGSTKVSAHIISRLVERMMDEHIRSQISQKVKYIDSTSDVLFSPSDIRRSLNVGIERSPKWYINALPLGQQCPALELVSFVNSIDFYLKRNFIILNNAITMTAYIAFHYRRPYLHDVLALPEAVRLVRGAIREASQLDEGNIGGHNEYIDSLICRLRNPALQLNTLRCCARPITQLNVYWRLIQPACELAELGLDNAFLLMGVRMALRFQRVENDPESNELYNWLRTYSAEEVSHLILPEDLVTDAFFPSFVRTVELVQGEMRGPGINVREL